MTISNNQRIVKNTLMLYFRQILILLVSLYTVRIVLNTLGVEDYGIYSVVTGIVTLFSFLSGSMASATQRFFSFALGQKNELQLKKIFSINLYIYLIIAVIAIILLETLGLWYVSSKLNLPPDRYESAIYIYHFSVLTFAFTIITTPFMAMIIAHEDMQIYAYVSIVEAILKLAVVFLLVYFSTDKLKLYGVLVFVVSIVNALIYISITIRKYSECQFRVFYWDIVLVKELLGFTGWTLFGQFTTVARNQAVTILLNQFYNPVVVAARAIALNVSGQIGVFANNFNTSLYPPIIKAYSGNEKKEMFSLIFNGSKLTFFLMWIIALPLMLEMDIILQMWLKEPPPDTVLFTRLKVIESLIFSLSLPLATAARAPGKMRIYELSLGSIQILIFFFSWLLLKFGHPAYTVFLVAIVANVLMFFVRLVIVGRLIDLSFNSFFSKVVIPVVGIVVLSSVPSYLLSSNLPPNIYFSALTVIFSVILSSVIMYFIGLNRVWREKINNYLINRIQRLLWKS